MKRYILGLTAYILTLSAGLTAVWFFHVANETEVVGPGDTGSPATTIENKTAAKSEDEESDRFTAEFRAMLPFEELDFPDLPDNLIDVYNTNGSYRESEVVARSGEKWLTLFEENGRYSMKWATAQVKRTNSISYPGDEFDVNLTFNKPGTPIFSVRNLENVKQGTITTLYLRPTLEEIDRRNLPIHPMQTGFKREFNLNEKWYTLRVSTGETLTGEPVGVLVLESSGVQQIIARNYFDHKFGTIIGELLWAGDLDNDGKLDLYFDEFNEKGYFRAGLYLSSQVAADQLVQLVAHFGFAGC